jgi:tRNA 2-selenouridine synthase
MIKTINISEFFPLTNSIPVVDVRSPGEFALGHISGAINIPMFSNDERAIVGTNYKKEGKDNAVIRGLEIVGPKLASFVKQARKISPKRKILLHCWRGGMRSQSMAWLLNTAGFDVSILEGGYKAYRTFIRAQFNNAEEIIILGGYTGSGKTDVLKEIEKNNEQFLDLEGIANHKGSAFGAIGQEAQPNNEQFENELANIWQHFDMSKPIWIEDESRQLGRCTIPDTLFEKMRDCKLVKIIVPKIVREKRLVKEYGMFEKEYLEKSVRNIERRLGGLRTQQSLDALEKGDMNKVAEITLEYYDKAYSHGNSQRKPEMVFEVEVMDDNPSATAKTVLNFVKELS